MATIAEEGLFIEKWIARLQVDDPFEIIYVTAAICQETGYFGSWRSTKMYWLLDD